MQIDFQREVLKFLCQDKLGRKYIEILDADFFDGSEDNVIFSLLKDYATRYKGLPNEANLLQYLETTLDKPKNKDVGANVKKVLADTVRKAFIPSTANTQQIKETVIDKYQKKLIRKLIKENAGKLNSDDEELVKNIYKEIAAIKKLSEEDLGETEKNRGSFLLSEHEEGDYSVTIAHPTYLHGLNDMTGTQGFYSPQLVIFMSEPKGFKTGLLLNVAKNYVRDGFNVYYADAENGHKRIKDRVRQSMVNCTFEELRSGKFDKKLTSMVKAYSVMGGDFRADFFPAYTKSVADVEAELDYLLEEYNWIPDIICYDYLDLFEPIDYKIKEKRLKIQAVYFDAIRLNNRLDTFSISLSQVSKGAVGSKTINMTDFAEDFGKAANCHAAFALCKDEVERAAGVARLIPVAQRDGVAQHTNKACFVSIDESRQTLTELSSQQWTELYQQHEHIVKKVVDKNRFNRKKKVTDD